MKRHYFVDYEVYSFGQPALSGHLALTWCSEPGADFAPEHLLARACEQIADRHRSEPHEVRIRAISRL